MAELANAGDEFAVDLFRRAAGELAFQANAVIRLLDLEQKTIAEISQITGWGQSMIKVRAFRARRKLQKLFQALQESEKS